MYAIQTRGLTKKYGQKAALENFDLKVQQGDIHALLGPNGAGKTTLVRILATLIKPDSGEVKIFENDLLKESSKVRELISLTGQNASVDEELTGYENMFLIARLMGFTKTDARKRARQLLKSFGLETASKKLVKNYSGGMRRRLDIAASIIKIPKILFLDEPTTGLDPRSRNNLWAIIRALAKEGTTVVLTTQYLEEADQLADQITVIDQGRLISEGTSEQLKRSVGENILHIYPNGENSLDILSNFLTGKLGLTSAILSEKGPVNIRVKSTREAVKILSSLDSLEDHIRSFSLSRPNLDEVFLALTGKPVEENESGKRQGKEDEVEIEDAVTSNPKRVLDVINPVRGANVFTGKMMFGWRSMLKIKHIPEQFTDALITPIMFTFMFTYIFGGALAGSTAEYLHFFVPGILVQTLVFNSIYSGMNIHTDISKGLFDRFRSMPIWSPTPLVGIFVGDIVRHLISGIVVLIFAAFLGFKIGAGPLAVVSVFLISIYFAVSISWLFLILGITMRSLSAVMSLGWLLLMPLVFMSNIFVDPATMPDWLQIFVAWNPLAWQVDVCREILDGVYNWANIGKAIGASTLITLILAPIGIFFYKKER
jgi:ABC transporter DrrB family efflux protein